jgi:integrase/recombinase XerC
MRAYRQDFTVMADLLTAGRPNDIALPDITKNMMRAAFVVYASVHEPASIWRCWSTWNVLCEFLYTAELIRPIRWLSWGGPRRPRRRPAPSPSPRTARCSTRFTQHGDSRDNGAVSVQQIH